MLISMKFAFRSTLTAFLLLSITLLAGCKQEVVQDETVYIPEVTTAVLSPGLKQTFKTTGEVFAHQISRMTAEQRGTVEQILVKNGDFVEQGQTLIRLKSSETVSNFQNAGTALQNARLNLSETQRSSESSVEAATIALETAEVNLASTLSQNERLRAQAEETLNSTELTSGLSVSSAQVSLDNAVLSAQIAAQNALREADQILGVSVTYAHLNDLFENNLGAKDRLQKQRAELALDSALQELDLFVETYESASSLIRAAENAVQETLFVLNNTLPGTNYTPTALATDTTTITTQLNTVRSSSGGLESAKSAFDSAQQDTNGVSQALINAEAAYDATIEQLLASERSARQAVESARNSLENARRSAELSKLGAKTSVDSAFGAYDQARISRDKLTIRAPFSGKVSELFVKRGEEVNPGVNLLNIEDDSKLTVVSYLSPRDRDKIVLGNMVMVNNREMHQVTSISPSADALTKKYKVEVEFGDSDLRPGTFVDLTFEVGENVYNGDRLFIPLPALLIRPNEVFVWRVEGQQTVKNAVEVGEVIGDYAEVLRGLSEGDEVIVEGGRLIEDEGVRVKIRGLEAPKIPNAN